MSGFGNTGAYKNVPRDTRREQGWNQQREPAGSAPVRRTLDDDYVDTAEEVIRLVRGGTSILTTTKLRNLFSLVRDIQNELTLISAEKIPPALMNKVRHLRVRLAYEMGRDGSVRAFCQHADLPRMLKEDVSDNREAFLCFARYMEALVAFHKFYGGKD